MQRQGKESARIVRVFTAFFVLSFVYVPRFIPPSWRAVLKSFFVLVRNVRRNVLKWLAYGTDCSSSALCQVARSVDALRNPCSGPVGRSMFSGSFPLIRVSFLIRATPSSCVYSSAYVLVRVDVFFFSFDYVFIVLCMPPLPCCIIRVLIVGSQPPPPPSPLLVSCPLPF